MPYNIYLSRVSNENKKIKNKMSRTSSLGMGAYIFREVFVSPTTNKPYAVIDKSKTKDDILFKGLLLPKELPNNDLKLILGNDVQPVQLMKMFGNIPSHVKWSEHYFVDDKETVIRFLEASDRHNYALNDMRNNGNERANDYRLYHSYILSLPVAKLNFPSYMNMTRDDLNPIMYDVIFELLNKHFLSNGQAVLFAFHLSEEDEKVHVHLQVPSRTFRYFYDENRQVFNHDFFVEWLSKNKFTRAKKSVEINRKRKDEWDLKYQKNPNQYNQEHYLNWLKRYLEAIEFCDGINDILLGNVKSGEIYSSLKDEYLNPVEKNYKSQKDLVSYFSKRKGYIEDHQDTFFFLNKLKEDYANLLNEYLIENGILLKGEKLYDFVPGGPNYITNKERDRWEISYEEQQKINDKVHEIFALDWKFYNNPINLDNSGVLKNRHLIVHAVKTELKKDFLAVKRSFALDFLNVENWVFKWHKKLLFTKANYLDFLIKTLKPGIFILDWRKYIKNSLKLFWIEKVEPVILKDESIVEEFNPIIDKEETQVRADDIYNEINSLVESNESEQPILTRDISLDFIENDNSSKEANSQNSYSINLNKNVDEHSKDYKKERILRLETEELFLKIQHAFNELSDIECGTFLNTLSESQIFTAFEYVAFMDKFEIKDSEEFSNCIEFDIDEINYIKNSEEILDILLDLIDRDISINELFEIYADQENGDFER